MTTVQRASPGLQAGGQSGSGHAAPQASSQGRADAPAPGADAVAAGQAMPPGFTLAVVGVGLIGGSLAAALRSRGDVGRVLGVGRRPEALRQALELGLIDEAVALDEAAARADLIVLAAPVGAIPAILARMRPALRPDTLITDVGSTKADVAAAAIAELGDRAGQFVPSHPIAGAERTGPEAADAALFQGRTVILTPIDQNDASARLRITALWERVGARVVLMAPDVHDTVLASVSHLPHLLACAYVAQVAAAQDADLRLSMAGSGFRDFTRIAAGSPEMWRDIFLANRQAVLAELQSFQQVLAQAEQLLRQDDAAALQSFLEGAALTRRFWGSRSSS